MSDQTQPTMRKLLVSIDRWAFNEDGTLNHKEFAMSIHQPEDWKPSGRTTVQIITGTIPPLTDSFKLVIDWPTGKPSTEREIQTVIYWIATAEGYHYNKTII